jgi:flagellin
MLSLHTNAAALSTQNALGNTQKNLSTSMTRLGTGLRINSAMDDAAGLQISTRLDAQTRGMAVAQRNTQNGISMMQTADGALGEVSNILLRMKDLATESSTASATKEDRKAMQSEYDALGKELNNIVKNTSFGGTNLFSDGKSVDGKGGKLSTDSLTFQIGSAAGETMHVDTGRDVKGMAERLDAVAGTYGSPDSDGKELDGSNGKITVINDAVAAVGNLRASLGAASNRLDHVYNNLQNMSTNTTASKGRITDTDYATETSKMTSQQMLMQASSAMLKQSNAMSNMVISLLQ